MLALQASPLVVLDLYLSIECIADLLMIDGDRRRVLKYTRSSLCDSNRSRQFKEDIAT
jgi:hypothetical protein